MELSRAKWKTLISIFSKILLSFIIFISVCSYKNLEIYNEANFISSKKYDTLSNIIEGNGYTVSYSSDEGVNKISYYKFFDDKSEINIVIYIEKGKMFALSINFLFLNITNYKIKTKNSKEKEFMDSTFQDMGISEVEFIRHALHIWQVNNGAYKI